MDLLYGLQGLADDSGEDAIIEDEPPVGSPEFPPGSLPPMETGPLPSAEELLKMLDGMTGLSDEDRENLREELTRTVAAGGQYGQQQLPPASIFTSQAFVLFALLAFIALIFVFFGYKLYKGLVEREQKREQKRKLKQLKKKK